MIDKTVRQIIIDFWGDLGIYDLFGRDKTKLSYSDAVDLETRILDSVEFLDSESAKNEIEELKDQKDRAESDSEDALADVDYANEKIETARDELEEIISDLKDLGYMSSLVDKLKDVRNELRSV